MISNRQSPAQFPEVQEFEAILELEAKRPIAKGKENVNFTDFSVVIRWLEVLGISTEFFTKKETWQEKLHAGLAFQSQVVSRTLEEIERGNREFEQLMTEVTNYLGEEDQPQSADIIFVFGSKNLARIETAVGLYKRGIAPKIFISGGMPVYEKREKSEAINFRDWAIERGIPSERVFIHNNAIGVVDNVRGGLNEMDAAGLPYRSMVLVIAWFAMRRSWAHMMKYVPEETKLFRVVAPISSVSNLTKDGWWKNKDGIKIILNEFVKLKMSEIINSA